MSMQSVTIGGGEYNQMLDDRKQITELQRDNAELREYVLKLESISSTEQELQTECEHLLLKNSRLERIIAERERAAKVCLSITHRSDAIGAI